MLKQVFRTETFKYPAAGYSMGTFGVYGMAVTTVAEQKEGNTSIVLHGVYATTTHDGADFFGMRFDSITGKLIKTFDLFPGGPAGFLTSDLISTARSGKYWTSRNGNADGVIYDLHYGNIVTVLPGETIDKGKEEPFWIFDGTAINYTHWTSAAGTIFFPGGAWVIDDVVAGGGRFLCNGFWTTYGGDGSGRPTTDVNPYISMYWLSVFNWTSGKWIYDLPFPGEIVSLTLEDNDHVYVLCQNRTIVLVDYMRGEILGATKLPPLETGNPYGAFSGLDPVFAGTRIAWDKVSKRLLVCEKTPDNPDGSCTMYVRGYRLVPEPVRLSTPIPLKVPKQGRTIPVLVQVTDDMNVGVGGYAVEAVAMGSGSVVGVPLSDYMGNTIVQVACEGSPQFSPAIAFDWSTTGSPEALPYPHAGLVTITASIHVPIPETPVTGVPGATPGGTPGDPAGGTDPGTSLPATAPNMMYILQQVLDSGHWNLGTGDDTYDQTAADGRGAFTDVAVRAIHDADARFGNIDKNPGQKQYNGHAIDALNFKNDDGTTAEIYDIISGSGSLQWGFSSRGTGELGIWRFP